LRTANRRELVERAAKAEQIASLGEVFKTTKVVVVAHYSGLTVAQMQTLRRQMKQAGASVKVAKNRLAKIALEGSDVASIGSLLKGPTLIAFSGDPVAAPKAAVDFAKTHERFVIIGGAMGKTALDPNGVKALAALPSLDELRAKIVGLIQAPATKIAQVVNAPAAKVANDFAKAHEKFVILGGAMGKTALNPDGIKVLASLPSLDELRAKIVGLVQAPATKIAQVVNAPAAKLARVLQAYAKKGEAA
jgi:large subunit ribosomal protein L10